MGQICCRPSQPPASPTSTLTTANPLTTSYDTPTPTSYVAQRPSTSVNITKCPECNQLTSTLYWNWCQHCSARHFSANFTSWSSGNPSLDKLIQEIQLNATHGEQVIEWIPYEKFRNVRYISKGGFGEVMYAEWEDGQIYNWDTERRAWRRRGKHPVALKRLKGSEECPESFLNEVKSLHSITRQNLSFEVTHCFGISQDPTTKEYIMIISYAENGSLHHYLQQHQNIDWSTRICYLLKIAQGLDTIHSAGLIHRDFHSGNILVGKRYPIVSDFGLSRYVGENGNGGEITGGAVGLSEDSSGDYGDDDNSSIFGVIPYVDPEVLRGHAYTPASDIYSFGMIMYELLTGHQPFHDTAHDFELITRITLNSADNMPPTAAPTSALNSTTTLVSGSNPNSSATNFLNPNRPSLHNVQHPKCWIQLMRKCWNDDPAKRPTTTELKEVLEKWYQLMETNVTKNREDLEIMRDFRDAENLRIILHERNNMSGSPMNNNVSMVETQERHSEAYYYSRRIPTMKLVKKLEGQMGTGEVRDYINLQYLQKEPSANSSRSNLEKSSFTMMTTTKQAVNKSTLSPYGRWSSSTWNNIVEDRDVGESDTEGDASNRDNRPNNSNSSLGIVSGVVEVLRNSFEEMDEIDGDDTGDTSDISPIEKTNLEDKIFASDGNKLTNDLSLSVGSESDYFPNNDGNALSQSSDLGISNNDSSLVLVSPANDFGSPITYPTQDLSSNDSKIISINVATSYMPRNHNYFRNNTRKNSLTQSYKTLIHDYSQRDRESGLDNYNTTNYNENDNNLSRNYNNYSEYFKSNKS